MKKKVLVNSLAIAIILIFVAGFVGYYIGKNSKNLDDVCDYNNIRLYREMRTPFFDGYWQNYSTYPTSYKALYDQNLADALNKAREDRPGIIDLINTDKENQFNHPGFEAFMQKLQEFSDKNYSKAQKMFPNPEHVFNDFTGVYDMSGVSFPYIRSDVFAYCSAIAHEVAQNPKNQISIERNGFLRNPVSNDYNSSINHAFWSVYFLKRNTLQISLKPFDVADEEINMLDRPVSLDDFFKSQIVTMRKIDSYTGYQNEYRRKPISRYLTDWIILSLNEIQNHNFPIYETEDSFYQTGMMSAYYSFLVNKHSADSPVKIGHLYLACYDYLNDIDRLPNTTNIMERIKECRGIEFLLNPIFDVEIDFEDLKAWAKKNCKGFKF